MKKRFLTPEEQKMWEHVTRDDLPFHARQIEPMAVKPLAFATDRAGNRQPYGSFDFVLPDIRYPLECGTYAGIDRNTAGRFRKGEWEPEATLDLHGMTREKAHMSLTGFLRAHYQRASRCLLIITGKGGKPELRKHVQGEAAQDRMGGVLREALPQWLTEPGLRPMVLAFDVAKPKHGGSGAYYILLRRKR